MASKQSLKKMYESKSPRLKRKALAAGYQPHQVTEESKKSLGSQTVDELKELLREAGKKVSGTKDELIERLQE